MYDEFRSRGLRVLAIAQEDADLKSHAKILRRFRDGPAFDIACDVGRAHTARLERTTTYLVDRGGIVRQVFPSVIHHRPDWTSILAEVDRIRSAGD